jgi:hypothetical protein
MGSAASITDHRQMIPALDDVQLSCAGEPLTALPRCSGVYRFFSDSGQLLYVGKSVDIHSRVGAHRNSARDPGRQQRMLSAVHRIDCELCAGEVHALLVENRAIKQEQPLYNRRQRRPRSLCTIALEEDARGFLRIAVRHFCAQDQRLEDVFGLYRNPAHVEGTVRRLAREQGLCLRMLGLDRGRGPCFAQQIRRCRGACAGRESAAEHNTRLRAALEPRRIAAWPFAGPLLLRECAQTPLPGQPQQAWHLLRNWSYLGSFADKHAALAAAQCPAADSDFDRDAYGIVLRALRAAQVQTWCGQSGLAIANPFASPLASPLQGADAPADTPDTRPAARREGITL